GLGIQREKLLNHDIGLEADRLRVGPYVGAAEDALRPPREVIAFEAFEQRGFDLGFRRNVLERNLPLLALLAQPRTKTRFHYTHLESFVLHNVCGMNDPNVSNEPNDSNEI